MIRRGVAVGLLLVALAGCTSVSANGQDRGATPSGTVRTESSAPSVAPPGIARVAQPARSQRVRFIPQRVVLPGGAAAVVEPADTVGGVLQVPDDIRKIGWWSGGAYVGDPFGATVLAGHVDSVDQGIGFFARLLKLKSGDRVRVSAGAHQATYEVASVGLVAKRALADDGAAFDQSGDARLVLITCGGEFMPAEGGYQSNLVVVARPVGAAR